VGLVHLIIAASMAGSKSVSFMDSTTAFHPLSSLHTNGVIGHTGRPELVLWVRVLGDFG
jgi:hypothetical protein